MTWDELMDRLDTIREDARDADNHGAAFDLSMLIDELRETP